MMESTKPQNKSIKLADSVDNILARLDLINAQIDTFDSLLDVIQDDQLAVQDVLRQIGVLEAQVTDLLAKLITVTTIATGKRGGC